MINYIQYLLCFEFLYIDQRKELIDSVLSWFFGVKLGHLSVRIGDGSSIKFGRVRTTLLNGYFIVG